MERRFTARFTARWVIATSAVLALVAVGCETTPEEPETTGETGSEFREEPMPRTTEPEMGSSREMPAEELEPVYFDFDRSAIRSDAKPVLRTNAATIRNSGWDVVTVEGHCDERGSEEYNLALGDRRANSVKRYLVDLGVSGRRLRTVSFGESKPAVMGHDESAWRYNRRSEFTPR